MFDKKNINTYNVCTSIGSFQWDPAKNASNIQKHGVSFEEAISVFEDSMAFIILDRFHTEEERFIAVGISSKANILYVCHCYRGPNDSIRIISARKATAEERLIYERRLFSEQ